MENCGLLPLALSKPIGLKKIPLVNISLLYGISKKNWIIHLLCLLPVAMSASELLSIIVKTKEFIDGSFMANEKMRRLIKKFESKASFL